MSKIIKPILYLLCFFIVLSALSSHFDFDFGWHLQFGKDAEITHSFPYQDNHSYVFSGQSWVNHEWGNDLLVWQICQHVGYWPLLILVSSAILAAFIIVQKTFTPKITTPSLIITALLLASISHIMVMRPAMYSLLFFAVLWWTLEKLPDKKTYFIWPPLIWLWSIIHGSWVLAFIVICIYFIGNILNSLANKYWPAARLPHHTWNTETYRRVFFWVLVSGVIVLVNPYGLKIYQEVLSYFEPAYFKQFITEWVPSYTYPIFWQSLIWVAPAAILMFVGWKQKLISWPHILLFIAFFISGWQYKRNMMFFILICQPLITFGFDWMIETAKPALQKYHKRPVLITLYFLAAIFLGVIFCQTGKSIRFDRDIWQNQTLLVMNGLPPQAIDFLQKELPTNKKTRIFNEFIWGGYMIWALPQAQIFLDGRGTATWKMPEQSITAFEFYHHLVYDRTDGLQWIENSGAEYIVLQRVNTDFYPPDPINRLFFSQNDFKKIFDTTSSLLETQLTNNSEWRLVYSDSIAQIWKRLTAR